MCIYIFLPLTWQSFIFPFTEFSKVIEVYMALIVTIKRASAKMLAVLNPMKVLVLRKEGRGLHCW